MFNNTYQEALQDLVRSGFQIEASSTEATGNEQHHNLLSYTVNVARTLAGKHVNNSLTVHSASFFEWADASIHFSNVLSQLPLRDLDGRSLANVYQALSTLVGKRDRKGQSLVVDLNEAAGKVKFTFSFLHLCHLTVDASSSFGGTIEFDIHPGHKWLAGAFKELKLAMKP